MAGVIQGLQTGYGLVRDMQERDRRQEEREFQRNRQTQADQRAQELHGLKATGFGLQNQLAEKKVARFDVLAGHEDKEHEANLNYKDAATAAQNALTEGRTFENLQARKKAGKAQMIEDFNLLGSGKLSGAQEDALMDQIEESAKLTGDVDWMNADSSVFDSVVSGISKGIANPAGLETVLAPELAVSKGKLSRYKSPIVSNSDPYIRLKDENSFVLLPLTEDEAGNKYRSGINETRDSSPSPLKRISVDDGMRTVMGRQQLNRLWNEKKRDREARKTRYMGVLAALQHSQAHKPSALDQNEAYKISGNIRKSIGELYEQTKLMPQESPQYAAIMQQIKGLELQEQQLLNSAGIQTGNQIMEQQSKQVAMDWAGNEPLKLRVVQEAMKRGVQLDPQRLDIAHQQIINKQNKDRESANAAKIARERTANTINRKDFGAAL